MKITMLGNEYEHASIKINNKSLIKKSEFMQYQEAVDLIKTLKLKIKDYEDVTQQNKTKEVQFKEDEVNYALSKHTEQLEIEFENSKKEWFGYAQEMLTEKIGNIQADLDGFIPMLKNKILEDIISKLKIIFETDDELAVVVEKILKSKMDSSVEGVRVSKIVNGDDLVVIAEDDNQKIEFNVIETIQEIKDCLSMDS